MNEKNGMYKKALIVVVLSVVINSFISTFLSMILKTGMDSAAVTFYRFMLVSLVMIPWTFSKKEYRDNLGTISTRTWMVFAFYCFTKLGGFILWAEGLRRGAPAFTMTTLSNMQPIFIVVLAYFLLKEKTSMRSLGGILICLVGVTIIGIENVSSLGSASALIVIVCCVCCNSLNNIFARLVRQTMDLIPMMGLSYFAAGVMSGIYAYIQGASFHIPTEAIPALLGVSLVCTLLGHSMNMWSLKYLKSVTVSVISLAGPFCTAVSAYFLLGEVPKPIVFLGAMFMIAGLLVYQHSENKEQLKAAANK